MIVKTLNSQYEIDFENSRVRRLDGVNAHVLGQEDGEWQTFLEAKRLSGEGTPTEETDGPYVWFFTLPPNRNGYEWFRTSRVQSEES